MRVIAGKARRCNLVTVEGSGTRPTTDRIKETLFNMLQYDLYESTFLDLFAGSGAIGIEALSRGCKKAFFVENNKAAIGCINTNLKNTKLTEQAVVMSMDVITAIRQLKSDGQVFDYVFMDPPYHLGLEEAVLTELAKARVIHSDTIIILEADIKTEFSFLSQLGYQISKEKTYKTNKHLFLTLLEE